MHLGFYFAFTNRQIMLTRHRTFYMDGDDSDKKKGSFKKWKNMDNQFRHFVALQLNQTKEVPQMEDVLNQQ